MQDVVGSRVIVTQVLPKGCVKLFLLLKQPFLWRVPHAQYKAVLPGRHQLAVRKRGELPGGISRTAWLLGSRREFQISGATPDSGDALSGSRQEGGKVGLGGEPGDCSRHDGRVLGGMRPRGEETNGAGWGKVLEGEEGSRVLGGGCVASGLKDLTSLWGKPQYTS